MDSLSYKNLLQQVGSGELRVISLLAPARSSSTALERALLESPGISLQINDPWALYDEAAREEKTYAYILDRIQENKKTPRTILIKNVADYIPPGECWERWCGIVDRHIFLIRNPLLTLQSLFRMMVRQPHQLTINGMTLDEYARAKGYAAWSQLQEHLASADDFSAFEDLYRALFINDQKIHREPVMYIPVLKSLGEGATPEQAFAYRISGWEALGQHFAHTQRVIPAEKITVMDSTVFRAAPESAMRFLSARLGIDYASSMSAWSGTTAKTFTTDYDGETPYYARVTQSRKIEPPTEQSPALAAFPPFFQKHLTDKGGAFDIYRSLFAEIDKDFIRKFSPTPALLETDTFFAETLASVRR